MKKSIQLQDRDVRLFDELAKLGLLDTELVHRRHFADVTRRRCQQRLRQHQQQGLTRCVALNVWYGHRGGGHIPTIHCLTERGAEAVDRISGSMPRRFSRSDPKPETLHHRLAVVKARLPMDDCARLLGLAEPQWILEQDRRPDAKPDEPPSRQRVLYHEFPAGNKRFTCQPDAASLLWIPREGKRPQADATPLVALWEVDCSTERTKQTANKCPGYAALLERRDYRRYWPQAEEAAVRVFWVCRSLQRIESLCEALREHSVSQYFRFTTAAELTAETAFTVPIWRTIDGERREILRLPPDRASYLPEPLGSPASHLPPHVGP